MKSGIKAEIVIKQLAMIAFLAKYILRMRPGYFRLRSDFTMKVTRDQVEDVENGSTSHEVVTFKQLGGKE